MNRIEPKESVVHSHKTMAAMPSPVDAFEAFSVPPTRDDKEESVFSGLHLDTDVENNFFAPFQPAPLSMIKEALAFVVSNGAKPKEGMPRTMIDLGSGDGRWCTVGAQKFGFKATGIDVDTDLVEKARETALKCGVSDLVDFIDGDFGSSSAIATAKYDVCVCYLLPESATVPVVSQLLRTHYSRGSIVISPHFDLKQVTLTDMGSQGLVLWHQTRSGAFLYRAPGIDGAVR